MDIMINDTYDDGTYKAVDLTCSTTTAYIMTGSPSGINVIVKNASHKAYRGMGRYFQSWREAIDAYKSSPVKAMIRYAQTELGS